MQVWPTRAGAPLRAGAVAACLVLASVPATASAVGELEQKPAPAGCVSETLAGCTPARALTAPMDIAVSPDGGSVYTVAWESDSVAIFGRDPTTGELSQLPGQQGCVSLHGSDGACIDGVAPENPTAVAVSPDSESVYVTTGFGPLSGILIFDRDPVTGELRQKPGTSGCILDDFDPTICRDGFMLDQPIDVVVSPNGRFVYVLIQEGGVLSFARDPSTGELTQRQGPGACIVPYDPSGTCNVGRGLASGGFAISPDGTSLYVASFPEGDGGDLAILDIDPAGGSIEQKPGAEGCIADASYGAIPGCAPGTKTEGADKALVSPDGKSVYVGITDAGEGGVAVFDRAPNGALSQKPGTAGCVTSAGSGGACAAVPSLFGLVLAASPAGTSLYVGGGAINSLWIFDREPDGALALKPGTAGCIVEAASAGICRSVFAFAHPIAAAVSPDGASFYVASLGWNAIAVFDRAHVGEPSAPGTGGMQLGDRVAPRVLRFALRPSRFRVARRPTPVTARHAAAGSAFRLRLSERADLRIGIRRALPGRLVRGRCRAPSRTLLDRPRCTRWKKVGVLKRRDVAGGPVRLRFSGRIGRRALRRGHYRATVVATDDADNRSAPRRARFTVLRPHAPN
jgi:DNA-binding beta-propeller fold protein YncE